MISSWWTLYSLINFVLVNFLLYVGSVLCCPKRSLYVFLLLACELIDPNRLGLLWINLLSFLFALCFLSKIFPVSKVLKVIIFFEFDYFLCILLYFFELLFLLFFFNGQICLLFGHSYLLLLLHHIFNSTIPAKYMSMGATDWFNEYIVAYCAHLELFNWILTYSLLFCSVLSLEFLFLSVSEYWLGCIVFWVSTHTYNSII